MGLLLSLLSIIFSILSIVFSTLSEVFSTLSSKVSSFHSESSSSPLLEGAERKVMEEDEGLLSDSDESFHSAESSDSDEYFDLEEATGGQPTIAEDAESSPLINLPCELWETIVEKEVMEEESDKSSSLSLIVDTIEDKGLSSDSDESSDVESEASPNEDDIFDYLPEEVWMTILNSKPITTSDMKKFRLVSRKAYELATEFFDRWCIKIPDEEEDWVVMENLLDLRVQQATVSCLLEPLPFRPPGVVFKYPDLLKILKTASSNDRPEVSPEMLHILLQSKNLESLELLLRDCDLESNEDTPLIGYNFSKLETLRLCIDQESTPFFIHERNVLYRILRNSTFGNLRCLEVSICINDEIMNAELAHKVNTELLEFIIKCGDTLREVKSWLGGEFHGFPRFFEPSRLQNCSKLVSLEFDYHVTCYFWDYWVLLLKFQTNLMNLKLNRHISTNTLRTVTEKNYQTLSFIKLDLFDADTVLVHGVEIQQFDFSLFANSHNLKKLEFSCWAELPIEGINLSLLPSKLESLKTYFINISTEDLLMFSSNHSELTSIDYCIASRSLDGFGMNNLNVLAGFMELPKMLKIRWKITPQFRTVLTAFDVNIRSDLSYVNLNRDTVTSKWSW